LLIIVVTAVAVVVLVVVVVVVVVVGGGGGGGGVIAKFVRSEDRDSIFGNSSRPHIQTVSDTHPPYFSVDLVLFFHLE
jgi:hypothetical protein